MQLICKRCGAEEDHDCGSKRPLGASVAHCPLTGGLWVYVTNPGGEGIPGVTIKAGTTEKVTGKNGFAGFDPLLEGPVGVELMSLGTAADLGYVMPDTKTFPASITLGQISMVEFQLYSWLEIVVENSAGEPIHDLTAKIVLPDGTVKTEVLSKDKMKGGEGKIFRIPKIWAGNCDITFPELCDAEWAGK